MQLADALNTLWMASAGREHLRFRSALGRVRASQEAVLAEILDAARGSEFGRRFGFGSIATAEEFQARVPLSTFDDYEEAVGRIAAGAQAVLTGDRVELFEPTSGTTSGEKWIPYTRGLRRQFQRALRAWIFDLLRARPAVRRGRSYWSVSPALGARRVTPGGIPVGFDDDTAYLGGFERRLVERVLAVPPSVARIGDLDEFRFATLRALLAAPDLALVSIWSPSFLTALLDRLEEWSEPLCQGLERDAAGTARAAAVREVLRSGEPVAEQVRRLWPRLALISCWTDGPAARALPGLQALLPGVEIQPKGLLATEGCVSLPLIGRAGAALAVRSHFFEFEEIGNSRIRLAHELGAGERYNVVITTAGGLYRYQLRDQVAVVGFERECPLLAFIGKSDRVCDLAGEKLAEAHVAGVLERVFASRAIAPSFALLVPTPGKPPCYRLYLQDPGLESDPDLAARLAAPLEHGLAENPYYRHAVGMGQLGPCEVRVLDAASESAAAVYERRWLSLGRKAGQIKPAVMDSWTGWEALFEPKPEARSAS